MFLINIFVAKTVNTIQITDTIIYLSKVGGYHFNGPSICFRNNSQNNFTQTMVNITKIGTTVFVIHLQFGFEIIPYNCCTFLHRRLMYLIKILNFRERAFKIDLKEPIFNKIIINKIQIIGIRKKIIHLFY